MFVDLIIKNKLSVRRLELIIKDANMPKTKSDQVINPFIQKIEGQLSKLFDAKTTITPREKGNGKIVINYKSSDSLDKIISLMTKIYVEH